MTGAFPFTNVNRVRRLPERGAYDRDQVNAILDAGFVWGLGEMMRRARKPIRVPS